MTTTKKPTNAIAKKPVVTATTTAAAKTAAAATVAAKTASKPSKTIPATAAVKPTPKVTAVALKKPAPKSALARPKPTSKSTTASTAKPAKTDKAEKHKKPKMVRDSVTIPKDEYAVLDILKARAAKLIHPAKKTELLRAGIKALAAMGDASFLGALRAVPSLKTGRPNKS